MSHWQGHRRLLEFGPSGPVLPVKTKTAPHNLHTIIRFIRSFTMSIFGKIMSAIFGTKADAAPASGGAAAGTGSSAAPAQTVDVAPILDKAVAAKGEKLESRTSIVDLMKALNIDSSFA